MRILQINKFFHARGGADTFFFKTCDLLAAHGHEVGHFATRHPKNVASPWERFFVDEGFTENEVGSLAFRRKAAAFFEGIYCTEAVRKLRALIAEFRPDVAHVHNILYQLSPSIFDALADAGVPTVVTLHDYSLVCGAGTLYRDGRICEACRGGRHYNLLLHGCYHGRAASLMATVSKYVHDARQTWQKPALLISPSAFLRAKLVELGVAKDRVVHLPNFVDFSTEPHPERRAGDYVLYFGRFAPNKGITTLIEATENLNARVLAIGDGPLRPGLEQAAARRGGRLQVLPFTNSREELRDIIRGCAFAVVPSTWYENQPTTVLEAYSLGRPVIASRLGGIPELVEEGKTGMQFEAGNAADLRAKIDFLVSRPDLCNDWGEAGRQKVEREFSREAHYAGITRIYESVKQATAAGARA